jgi:hypothetical protein|tara:strand:- start:1020 stop:1220 length:201 start_codon:yes stop_codon:yes gene_type:complete
MERHAKTKFRIKGGAPLFGMMNKKIHAKAHDRMGMGETKEEDKTKTNTPPTIEEGPGKPPENKKEE